MEDIGVTKTNTTGTRKLRGNANYNTKNDVSSTCASEKVDNSTKV